MSSTKDPLPLLVYCASSIEPAMMPISAAYQRETGTPIKLETGASGPLVEAIKRAKRGDLFVPASEKPFLDRLRQDGTVTDVIPLAALHLVLAVQRGSTAAAITLSDLLAGRHRYAIAHEESAAGLATLAALAPLGSWQQFAEGAEAILTNVTEVAAAIRDGGDVDCGIVWDATAVQFGLATIELPELATAQSTIAAGVLSTSHDGAAARKFAGYLAEPDKGLAYFKTLGYAAVGA